MAKPKMLDAIALLKADHRKVEDLFEQFEEPARNGDVKKRVWPKEICTELDGPRHRSRRKSSIPACKG